MKARDIIPGWPRGKSTSGPAYDPNLPTLWMPHHRTIYESVQEAHLESLYREGQQAMVDRFRQHGSITPPLFFEQPEPLTPTEMLDNWRRIIQQAEMDAVLRFWIHDAVDYFSTLLR